MEVLKLTAEIARAGQLKIDLPTNLQAGKVNLIVIINPTKDENQHL